MPEFDILLSCQNQRYKIAYVDLSEVHQHEIASKYPVIDVGHFIAQIFHDAQYTLHSDIDIAVLLLKKMEAEQRILEGLYCPIICLSNIGILFEPDLNINAENLIKEFSKNAFVILLWNYLCDPPGIIHWGMEKEKYSLNFSEIGLIKIPLTDAI